jgi:hypothetical protein
VLAGKRDRSDDIGHAGAAGDERGPLVDHAIPDLARFIIPVIAGKEQSPQLPRGWCVLLWS